MEDRMHRLILAAFVFCSVPLTVWADDTALSVLLKPARAFAGVTPTPHAGWVALVRAARIVNAVPVGDWRAHGARVIDLPDATLLPGLIEAHAHLFLHPYNEASWEDQVLKESLALRVCRATNHARKTLSAGFT